MTDEVDAGEEIVTDVVEATEVVEVTDEAVDNSTSEETVAAVELSESSTEEGKDKTQQRIDKLTFERRQAERDTAYWKEQANKQSEPVKQEARKTLEDFNYNEAEYGEYIAAESHKGAVSAAREALREESDKSASERRLSDLQNRGLEFSKKTPDYFDVTNNPNLSLTESMVEVASEMDNGAAVLYHLGKNPSLSDSLANMSPLSAAREMGRIEASLDKQGNKVSEAPKPAPKLAATNQVVNKDPSKMTDKEFATMRRKQISNRS